MNESEIAQKLDEYKQWHEHQIWAESVGEKGYVNRDKKYKAEIEKQFQDHGLQIIQEDGRFRVDKE